MLTQHSISTLSNHSTIISIEDTPEPASDTLELDLPTSQALISLCRIPTGRAREIVDRMNLMTTDREVEMMEPGYDMDTRHPWLDGGVRVGEQACKYIAGISGIVAGGFAVVDYGTDKTDHIAFSLAKTPLLVSGFVSLAAVGVGFAAGEYANRLRYNLFCEKQFVSELLRILRAERVLPYDVPSSSSRVLKRILLSPLL